MYFRRSFSFYRLFTRKVTFAARPSTLTALGQLTLQASKVKIIWHLLSLSSVKVFLLLSSNDVVNNFVLFAYVVRKLPRNSSCFLVNFSTRYFDDFFFRKSSKQLAIITQIYVTVSTIQPSKTFLLLKSLPFSS